MYRQLEKNESSEKPAKIKPNDIKRSQSMRKKVGDLQDFVSVMKDLGLHPCENGYRNRKF